MWRAFLTVEPEGRGFSSGSVPEWKELSLGVGARLEEAASPGVGTKGRVFFLAVGVRRCGGFSSGLGPEGKGLFSGLRPEGKGLFFRIGAGGEGAFLQGCSFSLVFWLEMNGIFLRVGDKKWDFS